LLSYEFSCSAHQAIFTASWVILKCPSRV
jgi:hypothetical protein